MPFNLPTINLDQPIDSESQFILSGIQAELPSIEQEFINIATTLLKNKCYDKLYHLISTIHASRISLIRLVSPPSTQWDWRTILQNFMKLVTVIGGIGVLALSFGLIGPEKKIYHSLSKVVDNSTETAFTKQEEKSALTQTFIACNLGGLKPSPSGEDFSILHGCKNIGKELQVL